MSRWKFDLMGCVRIIRQRPILIERQIPELDDPGHCERHVRTLVRYMDTSQEIVLKIRYEAEDFHTNTDPQYLENYRENAQEYYLEEIKLVEDVEEIGHGPAYITYATQRAGEMLPYHDGTVNLIVMRRVPGDNLAFTLEDMRQREFVLSCQSPHFLRYDKANDRVYIIDYSYMSFTNPHDPRSKPITVDNMFVLSFDIWYHDEFGIEGSEEPSERVANTQNPSQGGSALPKHHQQGMGQENRRPLPR